MDTPAKCSHRNEKEITNDNISKQINVAILQENKIEVVSLLQYLVTLSIKDLFSKCAQEGLSTPELRKGIKFAYKEYLILDPYVRKKDFKKSQMLLNIFRKANTLVGSDTAAFKETCQIIVNTLERLFKKQIGEEVLEKEI